MPTKEEAYKQLLNSTREQIQAQHDAKNLVQLVQQLLERMDKLSVPQYMGLKYDLASYNRDRLDCRRDNHPAY